MNKKKRTLIDRFENVFIPCYSLVPIVGMLIINIIVYNGSRLLTDGAVHYSVNTVLDDIIPYNATWIFMYVIGAYVQWVCGFIMIAREKKQICYRLFMGEVFAKLITLVFFLVFPTIMIRPVVTGSGAAEALTRWIYTVDPATNLFPSVHCLESWFLFRASFSMKKTGKLYRYIMLITTLLVFASTVIVKQHEFLDIIGGILVVEAGLLIANKLKAGRIFEAIRRRVKKKCSQRKD